MVFETIRGRCRFHPTASWLGPGLRPLDSSLHTQAPAAGLLPHGASHNSGHITPLIPCSKTFEGTKLSTTCSLNSSAQHLQKDSVLCASYLSSQLSFSLTSFSWKLKGHGYFGKSSFNGVIDKLMKRKGRVCADY